MRPTAFVLIVKLRIGSPAAPTSSTRTSPAEAGVASVTSADCSPATSSNTTREARRPCSIVRLSVSKPDASAVAWRLPAGRPESSNPPRSPLSVQRRKVPNQSGRTASRHDAQTLAPVTVGPPAASRTTPFAVRPGSNRITSGGGWLGYAPTNGR